MNYGARTIGVYSRKKKLFEAYVKRCRKYKEKIVEDLENALKDVFRGEYDSMKEISKDAIYEILNLFQNYEYDSSKFTYEELAECTDCDYTFRSFIIDE